MVTLIIFTHAQSILIHNLIDYDNMIQIILKRKKQRNSNSPKVLLKLYEKYNISHQPTSTIILVISMAFI